MSKFFNLSNIHSTNISRQTNDNNDTVTETSLNLPIYPECTTSIHWLIVLHNSHMSLQLIRASEAFAHIRAAPHLTLVHLFVLQDVCSVFSISVSNAYFLKLEQPSLCSELRFSQGLLTCTPSFV